MADVRSRLAALRSRRHHRAAAKAEAARPKCTDPAIAAAAAAAGPPRQTWDTDFRERLAGHTGSDDELDEIVVLPPAPVKLDPIAARVAWRNDQVATARRKARQIIREQFPAPTLVKPDVPAIPKEEVNDEEELLLEEEVDVDQEGSSEDEESHDDQAASEDDEEPTENRKSNYTNSMLSAQIVGDILDDIVCNVSIPAVFRTPIVSESDRDPSDASAPLHEASQSNVNLNLAAETSAPQTASIDSARTEDSSRATAQLETDSTEPNEGAAKSAAHKVEPSHSTKTDKKLNQVTTVVSGRPLGLFSKLFGQKSGSAAESSAYNSTAQSRPCAFIEDEAEDEHDADEDIQQAFDSDVDEDEQALLDEGIVADSQIPTDVHGLAQFHREWVREAESAALQDVSKGVLVDKAMDLSELSKRFQTEGTELDDQNDAASFCIGNPDDKAETTEYLDAMFRDDNSRTEFTEDVEGSPEDRKQQARALWKARQRHREQNGANDSQAISLLDAFGDAEDEADVMRSVRLRSQLERACQRPNATGVEKSLEVAIKKKNNDKRKRVDVTPEWERRRAAMQRVQKRRRAAVSMERWSYACDELDRSAAADLALHRATRKKSAGTLPVGGATYAPKPVAVETVRLPVGKTNAQSSSKNRNTKKRGTSLHMLFEALGGRPTSDAA